MIEKKADIAELRKLLAELGRPEADISLSKLSLAFAGFGPEHVGFLKELRDTLLQTLATIDAKTEGVPQSDDARQMNLSLHRHAALLAISLLISASPEETHKKELGDSLILLSQRKPVKLKSGQNYKALPETADACNFHLSYLDQFVSSKGRDIIHDQLNQLTQQQVAAYPPIFDYRFAWRQMEEYDAIFQRIGVPSQHQNSTPKVYMFMSVKGGVGKTSAALAFATYLLERQQKCGIFDLDFSGPSLQFHLDIREISPELRLGNRPKTLTGAWVYPCFYDLLQEAKRSSSQKRSPTQPILSGRSATEKTDRSETELTYPALVLPDSPTINSLLSQKWDSPKGRREELIPAIQSAFNAFVRAGVEHVAIDMRPGLYGANGFFLRYISSCYPTRLILMGTPRLSDFATSVYECSWLSASREFKWAGPTEYVINLWSRNRERVVEFPPELDKWADNCVKTTTEAGHESPLARTSGLHIHAQRIWPYFYYRAGLPRTENRRVNISVLGTEDKVRELQDLNEGSFGVNIGNLRKTKWYEGLSAVFASLLQRPME
jgi:hypothetical protein